MEALMREAIRAAAEAGTPYGAVIFHPASKQKIIAANSTKASNDPTAHAEINAIRAAKQAGLPLHKSVLISTCEPCPMCAMAAIWAGLQSIHFGATIDDAAQYGRQVKIYTRELAERAWYDLRVEGGLLRAECISLFNQDAHE